jgi:FAD/FMN-containing dehydrogenase
MVELTGKVIYAGEAGYEDARLNFNSRFSLSPLAIVFYQSVKDVVNAVNWAQTSGIPVQVRSGRHNYEAFSVANNALIVDLNDMEQIQVSAGQATIQAAHLNWVQNFRSAMLRSAMQPHVTRGCYVNDYDRSIKNWQTAYYSNNWQHLKQVKQKYDPSNFFSFEQSITR